jgi:hypothetical protein
LSGVDVASSPALGNAAADILAVAGNAAVLDAKAFRHAGLCYVIDRGTIVIVVPSDRRRVTDRR